MFTLDYEPFTPTEQRLLSILADGLPHSSVELFDAVPDELAQLTAVKAHIWCIRQKLRKLGGLRIVTRWSDGYRVCTYCLVGTAIPDW